MKRLNRIEQLVLQFLDAKAAGANNSELDSIAREISLYNQGIYDNPNPSVERRFKVSQFELEKWDRLKKYLMPDSRKKLLDCAFGSGRDLLIAQELGYDVYGCELSPFLYSDFIKSTDFNQSKLLNADFNLLPYSDEYFDIVRHNASFLHLPLIGQCYTIHLCLKETFRVLKKSGILYIYTKEGNGLVVVDTNDGLGQRAFQLYDEDSLTALLDECGFEPLEINHYKRERHGVIIHWIEAFAQKNI